MKKGLIYFVVIFIVLICSINTIYAQAGLPLVGKLIIIDPGHGGLDPGTVVGDIYEKNINLEISLVLKDILESYGSNIILTREGDYDLSKPNAIYRKKSDFDNRIKLINEKNPDLYLSIHLNYLNQSEYYGPQVFYNKGNDKLAKIIQEELNETIKSSRNIKLIPNDTYMYDKLNAKGLLIECGFLSNTNERKKLQNNEYQELLAQTIAKAIVKYYT